jgi:hypothetical protein
VKATSTRRLVGDPALGWSQRLKVEVGGTGTVAQAGVVLPRLLADRLGLTTGLADVVVRAGFFPSGIGVGRWWMRRARWRPGRRACRTSRR